MPAIDMTKAEIQDALQKTELALEQEQRAHTQTKAVRDAAQYGKESAERQLRNALEDRDTFKRKAKSAIHMEAEIDWLRDQVSKVVTQAAESISA